MAAVSNDNKFMGIYTKIGIGAHAQWFDIFPQVSTRAYCRCSGAGLDMEQHLQQSSIPDTAASRAIASGSMVMEQQRQQE